VRKRKLVAAAIVATLIPIVAANGPSVQASSHREAPLISQDPVADNTDLYLFKDNTDPTKVDIVANYIGLEQPAAGPNFNKFGDDVLYEVHIDNDGDVEEDITYQFRFRTMIGNPNTFLYNTNQINPTTYANQNVQQVYSVRRIKNGVSTTLATNVPTPPVNIGPRSTPSYTGYVAKSIKTLPGGGKVFAGQRKDPFFVDLGSIFDLLALRSIQIKHLIPSPGNAPGVDGLAGKNVHSIVLQLPISEVSKNGDVPTTVNSKASIIGVYASSSRQRVRVLSSRGGAPRNLGSYVQVSRLGIPLVNEVLIPLGKKDKWNAIDPADDAQFFPNILDPEPTKLLPVVYPGVFHAPGTTGANLPRGGAANRPDLIQLLTGQLAGLSAGNALPPADLLRLNLAVPATPAASQNREGALSGQADGFPNGRRLKDDIVDIELQVLAGVFTNGGGSLSNNIPGTAVPYSAIGDGVDTSDKPFLSTFPYVATPISGYDQPATG